MSRKRPVQHSKWVNVGCVDAGLYQVTWNEHEDKAPQPYPNRFNQDFDPFDFLCFVHVPQNLKSLSVNWSKKRQGM